MENTTPSGGEQAARGARLADRAGGKIRSARIVAGLTQEQVAEAAGISPTYISDIERGRKVVVDVRKLVDLADAVGVPVGALSADCRTAHAARRSGLTTSERVVVAAWRRIPRSDRAPWVAVLERAGGSG